MVSGIESGVDLSVEFTIRSGTATAKELLAFENVLTELLKAQSPVALNAVVRDFSVHSTPEKVLTTVRLLLSSPTRRTG